jgi:phosphatidylserine/phosphatidylglycerophosphate/cardiolipin synthase-like enzyme
MKRLLRTILLSIFLLTFPLSPLAQDKPPAWSVYFSPHGGCTDAIIKELNNAKSTILVQAYVFTSAPIAKGLLNAHKRKIKVEIILDKINIAKKSYASAAFFFNQGIPVRIDSTHAIARNKIMIIDGETVITGSFNFTKAAEENNAENLLIIHDKKLADLYTKNWQEHERHSEEYVERGR